METQLLKEYLTQQLETALDTVPHISHKNDIEYLHRFRVAIRRTRSLLKLYLPQSYAYNAILKEIVQKTNELRELDVFLGLLDNSRYPLLVKELGRYRKKRFKKIWNREFMRESEQKLHQMHNELLESDLGIEQRTLIKVAENFYLDSLDDFHHLTKRTSSEELHALRIKFKISRYALEFLNSSRLKRKEKQILECKQIQDHFGEIQDANNQLELLKHFCERIKCKGCKTLINERQSMLDFLRKYM